MFEQNHKSNQKISPRDILEMIKQKPVSRNDIAEKFELSNNRISEIITKLRIEYDIKFFLEQRNRFGAPSRIFYYIDCET